MWKRNRAIGTAVAGAILVTMSVATATPASAETFGQYKQACFDHGWENSPYNSNIQIPTEQLAQGSYGDCVKYLQFLLDSKGWGFLDGFPFTLAIDGSFGQLTSNAVFTFQRGTNIQADSIVGPQTWTALGDSRD